MANIPPKTFREAKTAGAALDKLVEKAEGMQKEKIAAKGEMKSFFEEIKRVYANSETYENKMKSLIEDAQPENENADKN